MKKGFYKLEGNTIEYDGGAYGYNLDSTEKIPAEYLEILGSYIGQNLCANIDKLINVGYKTEEQRLNSGLAKKVEQIIKKEYEDEGWVISIGMDKAPSMWIGIAEYHYKYSISIYDNTNDCYQDEEILQDFIDKCLSKYAQINIGKLAKEEN